MSTHEQKWRQPPPGTELVSQGKVQQGDWFYIEQLGAWGPVPRIGWGTEITTALIARGTVDFTAVHLLEEPACHS